MKIYNDLQELESVDSLDRWFELCPPMKKEAQWKDFRSAKEMAKFWLNNENTKDFQKFIQQVIPDFSYDYIIPEYVSIFDNLNSPRRHDLFVAEKNNKAVITIEGKADESFGDGEFGKRLIESIEAKNLNKDSKIFDRLIYLYRHHFHNNGSVFPIMYQLTHWFAGSMVDAIKAETNNIIMVLQEFKSDYTNPEKVKKNHEDFENFIEFISEGKFKQINNRQIIGPITNKYTNDKQSYEKNLYIGYYSVNLEV